MSQLLKSSQILTGFQIKTVSEDAESASRKHQDDSYQHVLKESVAELYGCTSLKIIFRRAVFSLGHASITASSMSSSAISCRSDCVVAFVVAFAQRDEESFGVAE